MGINYKLARRRGLSMFDVGRLQLAHAKMNELAEDWNSLLYYQEETPTESDRKWLKGEVEELEFDMQELWGFDKDKSKHTHWRRFPGLRPKREEKLKDDLLSASSFAPIEEVKERGRCYLIDAPAGFTMDEEGAISVADTVLPGHYTIVYRDSFGEIQFLEWTVRNECK